MSDGRQRMPKNWAFFLPLFFFNFSLTVAFASFPRNRTISASLHFCFSFNSHVP